MYNKGGLTSKNVFIVGGITHVPEHEFPEHVDFFGAMSLMLQMRYGLNPSFALLDNEVWLRRLPRDKRALECYRIDQASVEWAGILIADLSVPSTGTGQELERAQLNNTPIILLAKEEMRKEVTPYIEYETQTTSGKTLKHKIMRGTGAISLMVEGNPSIVQPPLIYSNDGAKGRSIALKMLDEVLQKRFGLTPITKRLQRAIDLDSATLEGKKNLASESEKKMLLGRIEKMKKMREMADSLLDFDPIKNDPVKYQKVFPFQKRLPLMDLEKGLEEPTHMRITAVKETRRT
jgi:hypothetical protein